MNYPGDLPPSPEERAELRLAANAEWLARAKQRHALEGDRQVTLRDGRVTTFAQLDAEMMERDNQKALAAARKAIEAERTAHKCYICGRRDVPRYARWLALWAAAFFGLRLYGSNVPDATMFGYLAAAAGGAAFLAAMYEGIEPDDEAAMRRKSPHS